MGVAVAAALLSGAEGSLLLQAKTSRLNLVSTSARDSDMEHFEGTIDAGFEVTAKKNTLFRARSDDFKFRVQFAVEDNPDPALNRQDPFLFVLRNIGQLPIELEHGANNFLWVEPGDSINHMSGPHVVFNLRDDQKRNKAAIMIHPR